MKFYLKKRKQPSINKCVGVWELRGLIFVNVVSKRLNVVCIVCPWWQHWYVSMCVCLNACANTLSFFFFHIVSPFSQLNANRETLAHQSRQYLFHIVSVMIQLMKTNQEWICLLFVTILTSSNFILQSYLMHLICTLHTINIFMKLRFFFAHTFFILYSSHLFAKPILRFLFFFVILSR